MKKFLMFLCNVMLVLGIAASSANASIVTYYNYDIWGDYTWHDAEKTLSNLEDDDLCWAAAASNILDWAGWDAGMGDHDAIFGYFQDHWQDVGGHTSHGWEWWFDGVDQPGVDVSGGGFFTSLTFSDYYHGYTADVDAMPKVAEFLGEGYGVSIGVRPPGYGGHAITAWGYNYDDETGDIVGIHVTDSDDDKGGDEPRPDVLAYYDVYESGGRWYLDDFYGSDWWIDDVWALEQYAAVPEPATVFLLGLGLLMLIGLKRKL